MELSQRHPRDTLCSSGRAASPQLTLTSGSILLEADIPCALSPSDLQETTEYEHTAGRCCLYRAVVRFGIPVRYGYPTCYTMTLPWWRTAVELWAYYARTWHQLIERCWWHCHLAGWGIDSAYSTASMEDLQSSEWYCRSVKMTTVVADITRTCWVQWNSRQECWPLKTALYWVVSPCSAPSGAKRAGSHRRSNYYNTSYYDIWRRDGSLSSSPPERPEVPSLWKPCECLGKNFGAGPVYGLQPRRILWAFYP